MEHVAIMKKSWGLTEKILTGQKKIESRWYKSARKPWDSIRRNDTIYFKNSGEAVTIKSKVKKVIQFSGLTPPKVRSILKIYGKLDGIDRIDLAKFYKLFKDKKFCILVFISKAESVSPFRVNKNSFGSMAAWISVPKVSDIKIRV